MTKILNWLFLAGLSLAWVFVLGSIDCPAYHFLGPMISGVIVSLAGRAPDVPKWSFPLAQSFIGALVARGFSHGFWAILAGSWPYLVIGTIWAILLGSLMSLILLKLRLIHENTAFWSLSPGGAAIMVIMASEHGGNMAVVAFGQYFRVLLISVAAVLVSSFFMEAQITRAPIVLFPPVPWLDLGLTLVAVALGLFIAHLFPFIPGGQLLIPMVLAGFSKNYLDHSIFLPPWLLYPCYALMGWRIGLSFTRESLKIVLRLIPGLFLGIMGMFAGCAFFGWVMALGTGLDPLTAYLASCPGGLDAVTIIAASSGADLPFITAMQAMRLIMVISLGPWFYGLLSRHFNARAKKRKDPDRMDGP
ncbi:MAG: AbrB family transcriptional regulator [Deltaproteobacteria bacterium]|jgi:membrane AbrB-like protein|nr:AbrB family transcriptional regulator [Deltaproteobacteria bacterium]